MWMDVDLILNQGEVFVLCGLMQGCVSIIHNMAIWVLEVVCKVKVLFLLHFLCLYNCVILWSEVDLYPIKDPVHEEDHDHEAIFDEETKMPEE